MPSPDDEETIPLLKEHARIDRRVVERSSATLKIETREYAETFSGTLLSEAYIVERRPVGAFVDVAPEVRTEGECTVYPVVEEVLVKRLLLREEVRVTPKRSSTPFSETVALRRQEASLERRDASPTPIETPHINPLETEVSS